MPLLVNIHRLDTKNLRLQGELTAQELDVELKDEVIRLSEPLKYDLEIEKLDDAILARGELRLTVDCDCVRCLKPFRHEINLSDWTCHLPLAGEEKTVVTNDCVDLTPCMREDILLALPQHPLCQAECRGLPNKNIGNAAQQEDPAVWAALNKLKL